MIRTIKAYSLPINPGKWATLVGIAKAYAAEKADQLHALNDDRVFAELPNYERMRDALLDVRYLSPHGLQGRMWKLALKDAYETVDKQWAALAVTLRSRVAGQEQWSKVQKHYANWPLVNEQRIAELVSGRAALNPKIDIVRADRTQVQSYLRRQVRKLRGRRPTVRVARSFCLDADMYNVFVEGGRTYCAVMSLRKGERVVIPLTGAYHMSGNVRVVLDFERQRVEIHHTGDVVTAEPLTGEAVGLDAGLTEVFTDEQGTVYREAFGGVLKSRSNQLLDTGRKRNKLHALEKKYHAQGKHKKANHIRKFNLGTKKLNKRQRQAKVEIARQVNTSINQVLETRAPAIMVSEKLDIRGKAQSREMSRRVSGWVRGILDERLDFKASARGSCRKHVNPAFTSQTCPNCGYLDKHNRRADAFQCQHCGHTDVADRVAALNLLTRLHDPLITPFTPVARVRSIVVDRFTARLSAETGQPQPPVSGRTPGTKRKRRQPERETTGAIPQLPGAK